MAQAVIYLNFMNNCKQAMHFYQECLGGNLEQQTVGESPMAAHMPGVPHSLIMHSMLTSGNITIMGSDIVRGEEVANGNGYNICLVCDSGQEIKEVFSKLSAGGIIVEPLATATWGAIFGMLTDKYGKSWMFNYTL